MASLKEGGTQQYKEACGMSEQAVSYSETSEAKVSLGKDLNLAWNCA